VKRIWQQYAARMEAATLRERAMIFAAAAVVMIALLNALLIEPELLRQRRLSAEVAKRQEEIRVMQDQLQKIAQARQADPDQVNRVKLEGLRKQIAAADARLGEEQRKFAPPEQIGPLLEQMLSRNRKLQLVDMRTLPATALAADGSPQKPGADQAQGKPASGAPIYRHGVELTVSGSYLDLLAYLRDLERLPNQMYWGKLDLNAQGYPLVTMKLSVYTLSLDLAWLVV
jgi:MSHA biogenesis protein MshJ